MATFLFKLILSPLLIGGASLVGRRWGPAVGGWIIGLPLTSGPVVLFLALDQGTTFAAAAAPGIMLGITSVGVFCLAYSRLAQRWSWLPTFLTSWGLVLLWIVVLTQVALPLLPAFIAIVLGLGAVVWLLPASTAAPPVGPAPRWDIPVRMGMASGFVVVLTGLAQILGPHLSGLLAPLPIFATILGVFTHRFQGPAAVARLFRGIVLGTFSFAGFFVVLGALLQPAGIVLAFLAAAAAALAVQGCTLWLLHRTRRDTPLPASEP